MMTDNQSITNLHLPNNIQGRLNTNRNILLTLILPSFIQFI